MSRIVCRRGAMRYNRSRRGHLRGSYKHVQPVASLRLIRKVSGVTRSLRRAKAIRESERKKKNQRDGLAASGLVSGKLKSPFSKPEIHTAAAASTAANYHESRRNACVNRLRGRREGKINRIKKKGKK